ncbi:MAG: nicotinate (nicotinamide) nucleotide adenylyltransferase [Chlamydiota bacterium]|nr:nicotinate (nicotinamide) nucleotide adenylyltransferase [Chlamydiota bacterium]
MSKEKLKVGLLGGSFDPIHFGHLHLAEQLKKVAGLDEVWFIPARINPLKQDVKPADAFHRIAMVALAIENFPRYKVLDIECTREGPSYTVDTIEELVKKYPNINFSLLVGSDLVTNLHLWKRIDEIKSMVSIVVGVRAGAEGESPEYFQIPTMEVSSTEIRERLHSGKPCSRFVPDEVIEYIKLNKLYM